MVPGPFGLRWCIGATFPGSIAARSTHERPNANTAGSNQNDRSHLQMGPPFPLDRTEREQFLCAALARPTSGLVQFPGDPRVLGTQLVGLPDYFQQFAIYITKTSTSQQTTMVLKIQDNFKRQPYLARVLIDHTGTEGYLLRSKKGTPEDPRILDHSDILFGTHKKTIKFYD